MPTIERRGWMASRFRPLPRSPLTIWPKLWASCPTKSTKRSNRGGTTSWMRAIMDWWSELWPKIFESTRKLSSLWTRKPTMLCTPARLLSACLTFKRSPYCCIASNLRLPQRTLKPAAIFFPVQTQKLGIGTHFRADGKLPEEQVKWGLFFDSCAPLFLFKLVVKFSNHNQFLLFLLHRGEKSCGSKTVQFFVSQPISWVEQEHIRNLLKIPQKPRQFITTEKQHNQPFHRTINICALFSTKSF